jgi:hypothetical protein
MNGFDIKAAIGDSNFDLEVGREYLYGDYRVILHRIIVAHGFSLEKKWFRTKVIPHYSTDVVIEYLDNDAPYKLSVIEYQKFVPNLKDSQNFKNSLNNAVKKLYPNYKS